jgi:hypothetical protein
VRLKLRFDVRVDADRLTGTVRAGPLFKSPVTDQRQLEKRRR